MQIMPYAIFEEQVLQEDTKRFLELGRPFANQFIGRDIDKAYGKTIDVLVTETMFYFQTDKDLVWSYNKENRNVCIFPSVEMFQQATGLNF